MIKTKRGRRVSESTMKKEYAEKWSKIFKNIHKGKPILKLQTFNWNKIPKEDQNKAIKYIKEILKDLSTKYRKTAISNNFWAQYTTKK